MDCSPPGSSVHGIFQARILEWVAIFFSRGSSWPRDVTQVSHITGRLFTIWATRESLLLKTDCYIFKNCTFWLWNIVILEIGYGGTICTMGIGNQGFFLESLFTSTPLLVKLSFSIKPLSSCLILGTIRVGKGESEIVILLSKSPAY